MNKTYGLYCAKHAGFILSDEGYDVFLLNSRGNTYSRNHTKLDVAQEEFWQFSFHEMGIYDLPATIDYILEVTKQKSLYYIGHSQGTTQFFVMGSERPEYTKKVTAQFSLAPVAFMSNLFNPIIKGFMMGNNAEDGIRILRWVYGNRSVLTDLPFYRQLGLVLCRDGSIFQELCINFLFFNGGFNRFQLNATILPVLFGQTPAGASVKQVVHFGQEIASGKFRQFDYGVEGNMVRYGGREPPDYDVSRIKTKVYLICGRNDWLSSLIDVNKLVRLLPLNLTRLIVVEDPKWTHNDFLFGIDAPKFVYSKLIKMMSFY